jgi:hypothetical protein
MKIKKNYFLSGVLNDLASQIPHTSRAEDTAPWRASAGERPKTTINYDLAGRIVLAGDGNAPLKLMASE